MFLSQVYFVQLICMINIFNDLEIHAVSDKNEDLISSPQNSKSNKTCNSPKCIRESKFYLDNMDRTIDPCSNFFSFACGGFLKKSVIPEDDFHVSQYGILNKEIQDKLINELKRQPKAIDLEAFKKIKNFYENCINEAQIEKDGTAPILELLDKLGGWPVLRGNKWKEDDYQWENTISLISQSGLLPDFPFKVDVVYNTDLKKYVIDVQGVNLEVDNSYNMTDDNSKHYIKFMADIAIFLGADNETAYNDMKECLKFELQLFKALYSYDEEMVDFLPVNKSIKDSTTEYKDIPWLSLFTEIFKPSNVTITENDVLLIHESHYISKIGKLLNDTPKRTLANHQIWRVIHDDTIKFLPKKFRDGYEHFKELIEEKDEKLSRENECLIFLQEYSAPGLNSLYVQKFVNGSGKSEQMNILENVKSEAKKYFEKLEWLDEDLRKIALEKVETVVAVIDYPEELLNNTKIENYYAETSIKLGSLLYSYLNISKAEKNYSLRMLRNPHKESDWSKNNNVARVTANYDSDNHRINIATGILQSPFFDLDRPKYLNYGGLGFAIGHELIHGIDTNNGKTNHSIVWKNSTVEEYTKRAKCIMDQFSNYTISEVYGNVDGEHTYSENIADGGGFKLGYYAYNSLIKNNKIYEPLLPGLNYTSQQMYWITIASTLCSKMKDVPLPTYMRNDLHSPEVARINVGFSNVIEFVNDFNCPIDSKMNPAQKCIVW